MPAAKFSRYVAIGDSQTEGLWDGDDSAGLIGFADRLAAAIDSLYPGLQYANLAVRGRRVREVLDDQLPQALAMHPDLITVCVGMNDVTRPGRSFDQALADLERLYARLVESGATVVTTTFPDIAKLLPVGRLLASRVARINDVIRAAAARYGFGLVDLYTAASMRDLDTWSFDRIHASTKGHMLFAAAAAEALNSPGSNHDWARSNCAAPQPSPGSRAYAQLRWTQTLLLPWVWRRLRGRSSGDGRIPKRTRLQSVTSDSSTSRNG
ncbi:MAG TPA: SGNH/GDSL hydrolase family protein [Mycobacterium sp.]|uniref:SGNH/GDSL hydrolase family protein n=1 Tax=Mycobacterium sp. TaxID=1785 RepID=UPI002D483032|nr:SGNH/GDSL hydrolase family protein [Mycobacterium sp.]HZU46193.1 SGNH/GDSL hydrolase family protein [Mycobacterium sp.]